MHKPSAYPCSGPMQDQSSFSESSLTAGHPPRMSVATFLIPSVQNVCLCPDLPVNTSSNLVMSSAQNGCPTGQLGQIRNRGPLAFLAENCMIDDVGNRLSCAPSKSYSLSLVFLPTGLEQGKARSKIQHELKHTEWLSHCLVCHWQD